MSNGTAALPFRPVLRRTIHGAFVFLIGLAFALATLPISEDAWAKSRKRSAKSSNSSNSRTLAKKIRKSKVKPSEKTPATNADETTLAALPKGPAIPVDAPNKLALESGTARAILLPETAGARISLGSSAFTSVMVSGTGSVDLLAEADGGEIADFSGDGARVEDTGSGRRLRANLDNGPLQLLLELRAAPGGTEIAGKPHNRIRLTLLGAGGGSPDSSVLSWELADCSRDYYAALDAIHRERDEIMVNAIDTILAGDETLPGQWLFAKPGAGATTADAQTKTAAKQCKKSAKRNDYITGEKVSRCLDSKANSTLDPTLMSGDLVSDLMPIGEISALADNFVRSQLSSRAFEKKKVLRVISHQLLGSLRIYLAQKHHPALCSGTNTMLDYYEENSSPLRDGTARMRFAAASAALHASEAVTRLLPGTAGLGSTSQAEASSASLMTPAAAAVGVSLPSLRKLIGTVARSVLSPADAGLVDDADALVALQRFRMVLDLQMEELATTGAVSGSRIGAAHEALGMIEAAAYLEKASWRFEQMSDAGFGTAEQIRAAHAKTCTCGN